MKNPQEQLFQILSHPDFLAMKGLANEGPIFIQTYHPGDEDKMEQTVAAIIARLRKEGISVAVIDLFAMVLDLLSSSGRLDKAIESEAAMPKRKMLEMLNINLGVCQWISLDDIEQTDKKKPAISNGFYNSLDFTGLCIGGRGSSTYEKYHNVFYALFISMSLAIPPNIPPKSDTFPFICCSFNS